MRSRSPSNFCSQCGSSLSPSDSFCSQCGSAVDSGGSDSFRSQHSRHTQNSRYPRNDGFRRRIEDLTVEGWDVKQDYGDRVVMINRGFGSIPLHILLLATTSGVGNLLYAWYCYSPGAERIELREDGSEEYFEDEGFSTDWTVKRALAFAVSLIFGSLGVLFGLFLLLTDWVGTGLVFGTLSLLLGLFLLVLTPQHVPGLRSPTTFGRVRSTDEKTVYEPATPCSVCQTRRERRRAAVSRTEVRRRHPRKNGERGRKPLLSVVRSRRRGPSHRNRIRRDDRPRVRLISFGSVGQSAV